MAAPRKELSNEVKEVIVTLTPVRIKSGRNIT